MTPKSRNRFSDKIMLKQEAMCCALCGRAPMHETIRETFLTARARAREVARGNLWRRIVEYLRR
jgi:hypothetical protein